MKTSEISLAFSSVLCLFWLTKHGVGSVQLSAPEVVRGAYEGSVTVPCQYDRQFKEYTKYWCKGPVYDRCDIVVKTPKRRRSERSSIADDKEAGVFTVTMSSLRKSDEDTYWCVIARSGRNIYAGVELRVFPTVITTTTATTANPSLTLERDRISWWATLRWILFVLMLCCLVSTHIAVWRMKAAGKIQLQQQFHHHNSNIYESSGEIPTHSC